MDQLVNPSPGFEDVIKMHFKLKKEELLKQVFLKNFQKNYFTPIHLFFFRQRTGLENMEVRDQKHFKL